MKFLFYIFDPNWESGGIMVMHELSKILCTLGQDVYLTTAKTKLPENPSKIVDEGEAIRIANQDDCITIYPEIIFGNPLKAKHVVRWVLYYPGVHAGDTVYDDNEYVFTYHSKYTKNTKYENSPILRTFESRADKFYPLGCDRIYDAVLFRKGRFSNIEETRIKHVVPYGNLLNKELIFVDNFLNSVSGFDELNKIFNQIRYFFSFDQATYYSVLASLSGCISIVAPSDGITAEQWKADFNTHSVGIAYGFDDLHWVMETQHKTRDYVLSLEQENVVYAKNLISLIKQKWNIS